MYQSQSGMETALDNHWWYCDRAERELLSALEELRTHDAARRSLRRLFQSDLHPLGIKELAARREVRIVFAMFNLLDSVEPGEAAMEQRLAALETLRAEAVDALSGNELPLNGARVLLQTAKLLIREHGHETRQLELAHDLRGALSGRSRFIRKLLKRYWLLEMPEAWNQIAMDFHVHDANSKGRKSAAHLVMDAWIKGIRNLEVIYYDFVPGIAAAELVRAAAIMNIEVKVGVAHPAIFRGRFVELICSDHGRAGAEFLRSLASGRMAHFREKCQAAAEYRKQQVLTVLREFNRHGRLALNSDCSLELAPITEAELIRAAGSGQIAVEHLAEVVAARLNGTPAAGMAAELLRERYIDESALTAVPADLSELPDICKLAPDKLLELWRKAEPRGLATLNLSRLRLEDVIELIYDCTGKITGLEIFNLKDAVLEHRADDARINRLRLALNSGDVLTLKALIHQAIGRVEGIASADRETRLRKFNAILKALPRLVEFYRDTPLAARLGSDSAGRSRRTHGMGMAVIDSLPLRARRAAARGSDWEILPLRAELHQVAAYLPTRANALIAGGLSRRLSAWGWRHRYRIDYVVDELVAEVNPPGGGNVVTLGGFYQPPPESWRNNFSRFGRWLRMSGYWNSNLKNVLKVLAGFIPAAWSFYESGSWWVLAWFGAFIWLGITGVRNVIQAVLGGGGLRRSGLLRWNDFISWERVADSLMYTGISVPLLEVVVKNMLIGSCLHWDAEQRPVAVFTVLALANSAYILAHNLWRGLPRMAVIGNIFRPVLAIPLSVGFGLLLSQCLHWNGMTGVAVAVVLQQWAAVLSKLASDCVGGMIEGYADRERNLERRVADLTVKLKRIFELAVQLELTYPKRSAEALLRTPVALLKALDKKNPELGRSMIVNALDMMFFWMYRPLAPLVLRRLLRLESAERRGLLLASQRLLEDEPRISAMFTDGLIGKKYQRALAFYRNYHEAYLVALGLRSKK